MLANVRTERVKGPVLLSKDGILEEQKNDLRPRLYSLPHLPKEQVQAPPLPEPKSAVQHHSPRAVASHGASGAQSVGSQQQH